MSATEIVVIVLGGVAGYWLVSLMLRGTPKPRPQTSAGSADTADKASTAGRSGNAGTAGSADQSQSSGAPGGQRSQRKPDAEPEPEPEQPRKPDQPEAAAAQAKSWFAVLKVAPSASVDEIRRAYKLQMSQYHPDKVAALGAELRELAERKTKDITEAYRQGMARHQR